MRRAAHGERRSGNRPGHRLRSCGPGSCGCPAADHDVRRFAHVARTATAARVVRLRTAAPRVYGSRGRRQWRRCTARGTATLQPGLRVAERRTPAVHRTTAAAPCRSRRARGGGAAHQPYVARRPVGIRPAAAPRGMMPGSGGASTGQNETRRGAMRAAHDLRLAADGNPSAAALRRCPDVTAPWVVRRPTAARRRTRGASSDNGGNLGGGTNARAPGGTVTRTMMPSAPTAPSASALSVSRGGSALSAYSPSMRSAPAPAPDRGRAATGTAGRRRARRPRIPRHAERVVRCLVGSRSYATYGGSCRRRSAPYGQMRAPIVVSAPAHRGRVCRVGAPRRRFRVAAVSRVAPAVWDESRVLRRIRAGRRSLLLAAPVVAAASRGGSFGGGTGGGFGGGRSMGGGGFRWRPPMAAARSGGRGG